MSDDKRVGIGTATPQSTLHVDSASSFDVLRVSGGGVEGPHISLDNGSNVAYISFLKNDFGGDGSVRENAMELNNREAGGKIHLISGGMSPGNPSMVIVPGGNVGIGTANPGYRLDVQGSEYAQARVRSTTDAGHLVIEGSSYSSYGQIQLITKGAAIPYSHIFAYRDGGMDHLQVNGGMHITGSGNVGIGTANPQQILHVNGSIQVGPAVLLPPNGLAPMLTARAFGTIIQSGVNGAASVLNGINISAASYIAASPPYIEIYFSTPMVNTSYTVVVGPGWSGGLNQPVYVNKIDDKQVGYFTIYVGSAHATGSPWTNHWADARGVTVAIFS